MRRPRRSTARHRENTPGLVRQQPRPGAMVPSAAGRRRSDADPAWPHPRARVQGAADWQAIGEVKNHLSIPLIANGDIRTPDDALRCLEQTAADGVMVGRGTMGAPWLVGQIDAALNGRPVPTTPDPLERVELARDQMLALVEDRRRSRPADRQKAHGVDLHRISRRSRSCARL